MIHLDPHPSNPHVELTREGFISLLDSAVDGMIIIDRVGSILTFNRAAQQLFGYQLDEVLQHNVKMLMPNPYHDEHDGYIRNYQQTKERKIIGIGRKVHAKTKSGKVFPILLSVGEYQENDQRYYIGIIRDLTEQLEAEQLAKEFRDRLAHVDRISTMGEMASGIAHELNQPLTAISSYVQAAKRRFKNANVDADKMNELLSKVEGQALRAGKVIERMRSLSKAEDTVRDRARINDLVKEAIDLLVPEATSRGVELKTEYLASNKEVIVDTVQIQQVVLNLVRNAIDVTIESGNQKGLIEINTQINVGNDAEVSVKDYGGGISDEMSDRLFHPFVTSKSQGTGLGLSISRSIIDAHGGVLEAENFNSGAIFRFTLPLAVSSDD